MINKNIGIEDLDKIKDLLKNIKIEMKMVDKEQRVFLNNEDVTEKIRSEEVTKLVSQVF